MSQAQRIEREKKKQILLFSPYLSFSQRKSIGVHEVFNHLLAAKERAGEVIGHGGEVIRRCCAVQAAPAESEVNIRNKATARNKVLRLLIKIKQFDLQVNIAGQVKIHRFISGPKYVYSQWKALGTAVVCILDTSVDPGNGSQRPEVSPAKHNARTKDVGLVDLL